MDDECVRDIADVITADNEGSAAAQEEGRPRGAVLVSTPGDGSYNQAPATFMGEEIKE